MTDNNLPDRAEIVVNEGVSICPYHVVESCSDSHDVYESVRAYLSERMGVAPEKFASNQIRSFWPQACGLFDLCEEARKKKRDDIASLQLPIPAYPMIFDLGTNPNSENGNGTLSTPAPSSPDSTEPVAETTLNQSGSENTP